MDLKIYNTRLSPTTNGTPHLGHIFMALVNEYTAHESGGKFYVRFDDTQEIWNFRQSRKEINEIKKITIEDIDWMGIKVDEYQSDNDMEVDIEKNLLTLNGGELNVKKMVNVINGPNVVGDSTIYHGYNAIITAKKVIADWMSDITTLIRGGDLITEDSLYAYFCEIWRLPQPLQIYLPRLLNEDYKELSKTAGAITIKEMREANFKPDNIRMVLRNACLKNPSGDWSVNNIRQEPRLGEAWLKKL